MLETIQTRQIYPWYTRTEKRRLYRHDKANIIEQYIANDKTIKDIAKLYNVPQDVIQAIVELYFKKPDYTITIMSNV